MNIPFTDRHIIVTGGTGGLGTQVVNLLVNSGNRCSIPCFKRSELDGFKARDNESVWIQSGVDLAEEEATRRFFKKAVEQQGDLWASVHLAGGFAMSPIEETSANAFRAQFTMNTLTCFNTCRAAIHWMRRAGQGGRIVNVAARPALDPRAGKGMAAYTVAKSGVASLTQALAAEVRDDDILINAIAPSIIDTPANRRSMSKADYSKWPKPAQIARQVFTLIAPENEITQGAIVPVYGKS